MKRIIIAALFVSVGAYAEKAATIQEPTKAQVAESGGHKDWPSFDEWANNNAPKKW